MPTRMMIPPVTADLWPAIRDRVDTATMASILGGTGRAFIEGDVVGQPWAENEVGGRVVIVPVLPVGGIPWETGSPQTVRFLVRVDFNDVQGRPAHRAAALAQREAARRLSGWLPVVTSTQVMPLSVVHLDMGWQPRVLPDEGSGTVFLSSSWFLDVGSAAD